MKGPLPSLEKPRALWEKKVCVSVGAGGQRGCWEWVGAQPLTDLFCWFAWASSSGFGSLKFGTSE